MNYPAINLSTQFCLEHSADEIVSSLKKIKAKWVRLEFDWYHPQDSKELVKALHKANINILGLLTGLVPGTLKAIFFQHKNYPNPYDRIHSYLHFVKNIVKNYPKITHWEIWNEPNARRFWRKKPSPKEFLELTEKTSTLIRKINKKAYIVMGGLVGNDITPLMGSRRNFLTRIRKIKDYVDAYAIHPYTMYSYFPLFQSKKATISKVKSRIEAFTQKYADKPLWITEYGISTKYYFFHKRIIKSIYDSLVNYCNDKGIPFFLWHLTDTHHKRYAFFNPEPHFGLFDKNLKRKWFFK